MKYSVTLNDSARHIVAAKGIVGAVKAALDSANAIGEPIKENAPIDIRVVPLGTPKVVNSEA